MGQHADDMVDGICCSICGTVFVYKADREQVFEHGFPVACNDCWEGDCGYPKQDKAAVTE